jgi:hypothetical protein
MSQVRVFESADTVLLFFIHTCDPGDLGGFGKLYFSVEKKSECSYDVLLTSGESTEEGILHSDYQVHSMHVVPKKGNPFFFVRSRMFFSKTPPCLNRGLVSSLRKASPGRTALLLSWQK